MAEAEMKKAMQFDSGDLYAALMHELKNNLLLLSMTLDSVPRQNTAEHDGPLDSTRLLCQRVTERLQQALLLYKHADRAFSLNLDAHSPQDLLRELVNTASALSADRIEVTYNLDEEVPLFWFFDRHLVEMPC